MLVLSENIIILQVQIILQELLARHSLMEYIFVLNNHLIKLNKDFVICLARKTVGTKDALIQILGEDGERSQLWEIFNRLRQTIYILKWFCFLTLFGLCSSYCFGEKTQNNTNSSNLADFHIFTKKVRSSYGLNPYLDSVIVYFALSLLTCICFH